MSDIWMELAKAITADERDNRDRAEQMWRANDVLAGLRLKCIADGLEMAREHMLRLAAGARAVSRGWPSRRGSNHPHLCVTCSDGVKAGPGCINCRQTGFDQTPWLACEECKQ